MARIYALDLRRLRLGLLSLVAALVVDAVDLRYDRFDVLYDGAGLLFYLGAALGIGQPAVRALGVFLPFVWLPFAVRSVTFAMSRMDATWTKQSLVELGAFAAFSISLLVFCLTMMRLCKGAGLASSARWRRSAMTVGLLILLPGIVSGIFVTSLVAELPFRHYVGSIDKAWWKTGLTIAVMIAALVATFDIASSAFTTWKSTGRRIKSD